MWENAIMIAAQRAASSAERLDERLLSNQQNLIGQIESNRREKPAGVEEVPLE
jgi:hypothetical protein